MALRINDTAPDFEAETTHGKIRFHDWIGEQWAILFSHPKDFTPVCTTELGYMARIEPEFTKRNAKLIGLSTDTVTNHGAWAKDIEETQGAAVKYPMTSGRNFDEVVRVLDSMQLTAKHKVATPVNWKHDDVIITPAVSNEEAVKSFPGFKTIKPDRWLNVFAEVGFKDEVRPLILKKNAKRLLKLC